MERLHAGNLTLWRERFLADLRSAPAR